ncbi:MAG: molybdenum cofactor guanylyltransferase [Acidobacteria bacterium]|nr:molybdenum cofactor guanylyltransferase [Acidobacteriota bacterium]
MDTQRFRACGFVLVGGQSRRMGRDKALLEFEGRPMLLRMADLLQPYVGQVTLLGSPARYSGFGLPVLEDQSPGQGPLGALYTGLRNSTCDWNLFFACDLPHLSRRFVEILLKRARETSAQAVVPKAGERWQPLCAAYHRSCLPLMEAVIRRGENLAVVDLLPLLRVEVLPPEPSVSIRAWEEMFINVNTAGQWEQLQRSEMKVANENFRRVLAAGK